ncbi:MAG: TatD family hydrolase [Candidatus Campbellbacteria bacterium]|nr:TatD family hydrolase [Candidatus Campbellbacteria bacterium]
MQYSLFDIHSHLTFADFDVDRDDIIERMRVAGIGTIAVGTDIQTSKDSIALAREHEHIFATVGIHPAHGGVHADFAGLPELVGHPKVVAIGECGLDYFRITENNPEGQIATIKEKQKQLFIQHIELAREHALPLMIHARPSKGSMDAYEDILALLESTKHEARSTTQGDVHFFAGSVAIARRFLDLGFSLSFDGPITFASDYDEVIRFVPDNMIMAETDAPFAAPAPFRGKRNEPPYVCYVVEKIALLRGISVEECSRMLTKNALRAFHIDGEVL